MVACIGLGGQANAGKWWNKWEKPIIKIPLPPFDPGPVVKTFTLCLKKGWADDVQSGLRPNRNKCGQDCLFANENESYLVLVPKEAALFSNAMEGHLEFKATNDVVVCSPEGSGKSYVAHLLSVWNTLTSVEPYLVAADCVNDPHLTLIDLPPKQSAKVVIRVANDDGSTPVNNTPPTLTCPQP